MKLRFAILDPAAIQKGIVVAHLKQAIACVHFREVREQGSEGEWFIFDLLGWCRPIHGQLIERAELSGGLLKRTLIRVTYWSDSFSTLIMAAHVATEEEYETYV